MKIQERSLNTILRYNLYCGLMRSFFFTLTVKNETLAVHITGTLLASKFVMTRLNLPGYDTSAPQVTVFPLRDTWFTTGYPPPPYRKQYEENVYWCWGDCPELQGFNISYSAAFLLSSSSLASRSAFSPAICLWRRAIWNIT